MYVNIPELFALDAVRVLFILPIPFCSEGYVVGFQIDSGRVRW